MTEAPRIKFLRRLRSKWLGELALAVDQRQVSAHCARRLRRTLLRVFENEVAVQEDVAAGRIFEAEEPLPEQLSPLQRLQEWWRTR